MVETVRGGCIDLFRLVEACRGRWPEHETAGKARPETALRLLVEDDGTAPREGTGRAALRRLAADDGDERLADHVVGLPMAALFWLGVAVTAVSALWLLLGDGTLALAGLTVGLLAVAGACAAIERRLHALVGLGEAARPATA